MFFISFPFLVFFLALLIVYYTVPKQMQVIMLLSASMIFYGWADVRFLFFILLTGVSIFAAATLLSQINEVRAEISKQFSTMQSETNRLLNRQGLILQKKLRIIDRLRKSIFLLALFLNLGILAVTKYTNFVIGNINAISGSHFSFFNLIVPMGISFYTFQAVGYLIDVYRGTITSEKSLIRFLLFTSFFPQLIQGPISKYSDLSKTLYEPHAFSRNTVSRGLERILWGMFKKMVIADRIRPFINSVFVEGAAESGTTVFLGMILFVVMLYADFSGGIDMTIGISESMGILITENFKQPFFSKSLKEYWRCWHITMGSWFRDYVFYPVSMSAGMRRLIQWNKKHFGKTIARKVPVYLATFITWFATGLWHGASWNYVCWGLANCLILILSEELEPLYERMRRSLKICKTSIFRVFQSARTFILICVLNLFDCTGSVRGAGVAVTSMFFEWSFRTFSDGTLLAHGVSAGDYRILLLSIFILFGVDFYSYWAGNQSDMPDLRDRIRRLPLGARVLLYYALLMIILIFGVYGHGYDRTQFIYNRF